MQPEDEVPRLATVLSRLPLAFVPLALGLAWLAPTRHNAIFFASVVAIVPLAGYIGRATEQLAAQLGAGMGGLLNATFGNAAELIIGALALHKGLTDLVKASITGSIIGNVLLVFGASVFVGGVKHGVQRFDPRSAGMNSVQLLMATIGLLVPATFAFLVGGEHIAGNFLPIENVSLWVAALLLALYGLSVFYDLTRPLESGVRSGDEMSLGGHPKRHWSRPLGMLALSAAALAWVSEILVGSVEPVVHQLGVSEFFLGIVLIPIIGNLAEHLVALQLARKNQMDFAIAVSLGSATQVALFAAPLLVFLSIPLGHPLTLVFTPFEVVAVGVGALITALIAIDGESNWLEGAQLVATYLILAVAFFFLPVVSR